MRQCLFTLSDKFHCGIGISKSGLDDIDQSPLHYFARHLDPRRPGAWISVTWRRPPPLPDAAA